MANKKVNETQNGDIKSQGVLMDLTWNHLMVIAKTYAVNKDDAEDILVMAYQKAFRYIHSFQENSDGYNWLCKVTQNVAYEFNKKASQDLPLESAYTRSVPADFAEQIALRDDIERCMQDYPESDKEIIRMHYFEDYSYQEIADMYNLTKSCVHKRAKKIMKEIERKLREEVDENNLR